MELRHLKYFVTVAEELSFSRAATRLYITQPGLSRQIKNLEEELGVALFVTQSDGLKLTEAGSFFLEQAKDVLQRSQVAMQTIQARYAAVDKPLVIGYIPTILQSFLGDALHRFGLTYPQVSIQIQEMSPAEQVKSLRERAIDVAFIGNSPSELDTEFLVECVKRVRCTAMLPINHRFAHLESIYLSELTDEKFIGVSEETFPRRNDYIRDLCRRNGFEVNLHMSANSVTSMIALVAAGQGVALIPREAEALPHPQVVFIPLDPPVYARSTAMWRRETPTRSLNCFLEVLLERETQKFGIA
ncbi:LysR family transcriptional regulator [Oscillatoria sp. FACHB-1406]|uniref:LysR family transcriptional regulator n=1 Tax=Oscillatoria sp. FACHB-1406 TaxID=2692846 RepID=UPI001683DDA4|nr:LysR family transcriptional regulator [Oscillatoria sp. FACHB-1406]MBD2576713.1 LysR family transcriptional regulator [Oscillatoria sp. FACHB-1406]